MENIVNARGVTHVYQDLKSETLALDDITFTVKRGEFIAIVGPSGCGKTTLLSILSGMLVPTRGTVTVAGKKPDCRSVGYMLQHDHLFEWQTIRSNVLLGLKIRGMLNDETKAYADELLCRYGLSEFASAYPAQLSGGMRQKAALIRTLALKPDILLLDEPFSALDFQTRLNVSDEVDRIIRGEGKTAILVTHDISEAIALSDRVFVLTKRPAKLLSVHDIEIEGKTSLERRTHPLAGKYFDEIWKELSGGEENE